MTTRRALRCLALSISGLAFALGGFAGCGGGDDSTATVDSGVDAARDATTVTDSGGCPASQTACGTSCVNELTDPHNCGACGVVCGTGTDCESGSCVAPCLSGQTRCSGRCVAYETDNANCGSCGTSCGTGLVCSDGACTVACAPPLTTCYESIGADAGADAGSADGGASDASSDAAADASDAGDASDASDAATDSGAASDAAAPAPVRYCARTASDENNCGGCGVVCPAGQQCDDGVCSDTCAPGETLCSGSCRDLATDLANCGACGTTCAAGQVCSAGVCQATCGIPFTLCGSACANTASDPTHCGDCTTSCSPVNVKAPACTSGSCNYVGCQSGFSDCDGILGNGCELSTSSDVTNCGGCGVRCSGAHVAATACTNGSCAYTACSPGFADCDSNASNGCETDLSSSNSCGACGVVCATGSTCSTNEQCVPGPSIIVPDFTMGGATAETVPTALTYTLATAYPSTIYYTVDGSTPTLASPHGQSPVAVTGVAATAGTTTTLQWATFNGDTLSAVQTRVITQTTASETAKLWALTQQVQLTTNATPGAGDGPAIVVAPGQTVNGLIGTYQLSNSPCPGCAMVTVIGTTTPTACPSAGGGGTWPGYTNDGVTFSLVAPTAPGIYPVHIAAGEQFFCANTEQEFAGAFAADSSNRIGLIVVR